MYVGPEIWAALLVFALVCLLGLIAWCAVLTGKLRHLRNSQRAAEMAAEDCRLMRQGVDKVVVLREENRKTVAEYTAVTLDMIDRHNLIIQLMRVERAVPPLKVPESLVRPPPPQYNEPPPEQPITPPPPPQSTNGNGADPEGGKVFTKPKTLPDEVEESERLREAKRIAEERRREQQEESEINSPQEQHRTLEGEMKNLPLSEQLAIQRIEQAKNKTEPTDWEDF